MNHKLFAKTAEAVMAVVLTGGVLTTPISDKFLSNSSVFAEFESNYTFDEETGTLTLIGDINKDELSQWFRNYDIKHIVAAPGSKLPEFSDFLFSRFAGESIDLSNADSSDVKAVRCMFSYCENLLSLDLSNFNTSKIQNMQYMFSNCKSLRSLDLSSFDTSNVTTLLGMFEYCSSLESLDLSSFDTSSVVYMATMFFGCSSLTSLDLSSFHIPNAKYMGSMFYNCTNLKSINMSNFETKNVIAMNAMFENCQKLESIDLSNFDTSNVTDMSNMFDGCQSLTSLDLSNFNTSNVTNMTRMFYGCESLTSLDLSNFDTSNCRGSFSYMFGNCPNLKDLDVTSFTVPKLNYRLYMFAASSPESASLTSSSVTLDEGKIGLNFYFTKTDTVKTAVLNGPNGEVKIDIDTLKPGIYDQYKITYYLNALQADETVSLEFYNAGGKKLTLLNANNDLINKCRFEYTVNEYLDEVIKSTISTQKAKNVAANLKNYCTAAENYLLNRTKVMSVPFISSVDDYAPTFGENVKISLVLNSAAAVRIYTDSNKVMIDGKRVTAKTSKFGKYYELADIPAQNLFDSHILTIDGDDYVFSPMSYVYRTLNNPNTNEKLAIVAKTFYSYAYSAREYVE